MITQMQADRGQPLDNRESVVVGFREVIVADACDGMRLDRFLSLRFADRSRSFFARCIREGLVRTDSEGVLASSSRVRGKQVLHVWIPGIAPETPPPPLPPLVYEDETVLVFNKPPGMLCHPAGTRFHWALVSLAKAAFPNDEIDLVHRIDRDTSGLVIVTRTREANRRLKASMKKGVVHKEYEAIVRGEVPWEQQVLTGPIGYADGPIRIQMAVREDGQPARTDVQVLERRPAHTRVRCILRTGRTHQIRVHLWHAGFPLLGDRLYGVPSDIFLESLEHGSTSRVLAMTGAERHALHHRRVRMPHPLSQVWVEVEAALPKDFAKWWAVL